MPQKMRLLLAACATVFIVAHSVGVAAALRSIEVSGGPSVSASAVLTFAEAERGVLKREREIACSLTLLRTVRSSIPKRSGAIFGQVTGVAIEERTCASPAFRRIVVTPLVREGTGGRCVAGPPRLCDVSAAAEPLWRLVYDSITGTLPTITGVNFHIAGTQFNLELDGINCLFNGSAFGLIRVEAGGNVTGANAVLERTSLTRTGEFFCSIGSSGPGTFSGNFAVSPTLRLRLV
jgi:hypothetical protein